MPSLVRFPAQRAHILRLRFDVILELATIVREL
jgi:hypothetical protein